MTSLAPCFGQETDQSRPDAPYTPPVVEIQCLCPFCGAFNSGVGKPCAHCELEDTTATRDATRQKGGQWHVLQPNSPASAGMNFDALLALVARKTVISRTVVRGPTTGQLWRLASKVRGLSREFGHCYACGGNVDTDETICPHCERAQTVPDHADFIPPAAQTIDERKALFIEPKITVHSNIETQPDPIDAARPVVAQKFSHRIPKDDLLTPRDVAKAFQLEFGIPEAADLHSQRINRIARQVKVGLSSVAALAVAFAMVWPLINVVPGWIEKNQNKTTASTMRGSVTLDDNAAVASARISPDVTLISAHSTPIPTTVEPTPSASPEDDPALLWTAGTTAQATRDYVGAVAAFERLESLPSTNWPADLETRLSQARQELKKNAR